MWDRTLEERYVEAWRTIDPGAVLPTVVIKKWPHGRRWQIITASETVTLTIDEFTKRMLSLEAAAKIIDWQRPKAIQPH